MPYRHTCKTLRQKIDETLEDVKASQEYVDSHNRVRTYNYCLWMLDQIESTPKSTDAHSAAKMGRWIGYVFGRLEMLGLINNKDSRDMARIDSHAGDI